MINEKYELSEKIGSGSFGTVYRGRDITTNELWAVKIEKPNIRFSQLKIEARILRFLEHE
jgi:casein kinase 1